MPNSPNQRLQFAAIGCDRMAWKDISTIGDHSKVDVVALCDVDETRFAKADEKWPGRPKFSDYREMFDQLDGKIDAVNITIPDHHHAVAAQEALRRGLHVYCQKPLTHTVWEARQITKLAAKTDVITRMGNQIHSEPQYRLAKILIQEEKVVGKIKEVHTWISSLGHGRSKRIDRPEKPKTAPSGFDWEQWIGPAPWREFGGPDIYHPRCWRDWQDFGSGSIGDNGCHLFDPLFTGLDLTAPLSIAAHHTGMNDEVWPAQETLIYTFPGTPFTAGDTLKVTWYDGGRLPNWKIPGVPDASALPGPASLLVGEEGCILIPHWDKVRLFPEEKFAHFEMPDPGQRSHWHDWVDACLENDKSLSDQFDYAGPLSEAVQLGNVAVRFRQQLLKWDSANLRIPNLPEAEKFLTKSYREGWGVDEVV
ncbi:MAG: putative dehydrogenase [Verrucomicrobiales bacterium]|jgi:predicted dehydrogenase